ncbi:MAG: spore coat protein SP96, partial [Raoultibacter sp.]
MSEESSIPTPPPSAPEQAPAPAPEQASAPTPAPTPMPQPQPVMPPQQPQYGQPVAMPALLFQLTGGMKFGYFALGFLMSLPGLLIAWLINVDKFPKVKSDALKFALIGFV